MEIQSGRLAATKQTWRTTPTVRELVAKLIDGNPQATPDRLRKLFRENVRDDGDYFDAVTDYAFDAAMRAIKLQAERAPLTAKQAATAAIERAKTVEYIKEQIILLNQEMPNGKRARYCTLDYLYRLGGAYRNAGKKGSQKTVGSAYSEEQFRAKLKGVA